MDAHKTNVLKWRTFLASSTKTAIHLGPDFLLNSEIYKSTKFENIENVFNITQKLRKEHSEEILNVECVEYSSPSWTRSILANDQAIRWAKKAKVCVYANSVLCVGQVKRHSISRTEMERAKLKMSTCIRLTEMQWESTEKRLNSSGKVSQYFRHCLFFARQDLETKNIQPKDFKVRIIVMSMFTDIEWKMNDENCISNEQTVKNYAMRFLQGHGTFLGPASEEKWYGDSHDEEGQWNGAQPAKWPGDS